MDNNRIIAMLEKQLTLSAQREKVHLQQIRKQSEQIYKLSDQLESLTVQLKEQTKTIESLRDALLKKEGDLTTLQGKNRGLTKLMENKSEKIKLQNPSSVDTEQRKVPSPKERGNNNAKRMEHNNLQEVIVEIWPNDPDFDKSRAHIIGYVDSIRYAYVPSKVIKKIYRQYNCVLNDRMFCGKAPRAPLMNSNYDATLIARMIQLRFIYSLPVERIIKMLHEDGFFIKKATAHNLIAKASELLEPFYEVFRKAIHEDPYVRMDETYHKILIKSEINDDKGVLKGYIWSILSVTNQLIHFFYEEGSRGKDVFLGYLDPSYKGAVQSDGFSCYKEVDTDKFPNAMRLACAQHIKRKFMDIPSDEQAMQIVDLINKLYRIEHETDPDWPPEQKQAYRNKKAPPILEKLKKMALEIKNDHQTLPSTPLAKATNYLLNEIDALSRYLLCPQYTLDNNPIELLQRYVSLSRRNSLFFGSHQGARRAALLYSMACSCSLHGINTFEYFTDILNRMPYIPPNVSYEQLRRLLPDKWTKEEA